MRINFSGFQINMLRAGLRLNGCRRFIPLAHPCIDEIPDLYHAACTVHSRLLTARNHRRATRRTEAARESCAELLFILRPPCM